MKTRPITLEEVAKLLPKDEKGEFSPADPSIMEPPKCRCGALLSPEVSDNGALRWHCLVCPTSPQ
jgi:hypothetical protein